MTTQIVVTLIAILAPLIGVPLSVITFYLRALKDDHNRRSHDTAAVLHALEERTRNIEMVVDAVRRDYTTKEEWLRESMLARQQLERLTEMVARMQARLDDRETLSTHLTRTTEAMVDLASRIGVLDTDGGRA